MLTNDEINSIDRALLPMRIIWVALLIACGVYLIIANIITTGTLLTDGEAPDRVLKLVGYFLYAIGAIQLLIAYYLRKAVNNQKSIFSRFFNSQQMPDPSTDTTQLDWAETGTARYFIVLFICLAFAESIAIYGLIICIMSADFFSLYLLVGIAIAAQLYFRPKKMELMNLVLRIKRYNRIK